MVVPDSLGQLTPPLGTQISRAVSGQDYPTEPDDLAISKLVRATIANA